MAQAQAQAQEQAQAQAQAQAHGMPGVSAAHVAHAQAAAAAGAPQGGSPNPTVSTSMSSNILAQAQVQLDALKSQAGKTSAPNPAAITTMAGMAPTMSLPFRGLTAGGSLAGLPAGLTLQQAQAYGLGATALTDPYLGQSIGPIAGYQNSLYRRFTPY